MNLAERIATSRTMLVFAFRVQSEIYEGRLGPGICSRAVNIVTGGPGVHLTPDDHVSSDELHAWAQNMSLLALYGSALTCDEMLNSLGVSRDGDTGPACVRVLVNQVRNAFAHSPWQPKWRIFEKYRRDYVVELANGACHTFAAGHLDGEFIKPEDYGGVVQTQRLMLLK